MNRPARFTQAELARALRAAVAAGVSALLRPDGSILFNAPDIPAHAVIDLRSWPAHLPAALTPHAPQAHPPGDFEL